MRSRPRFLTALIFAGSCACFVTAAIGGLSFSPGEGAGQTAITSTLLSVSAETVTTLYLSVIAVPLGLFGAMAFLAGPLSLAARKPSRRLFIAMGVLAGLAHTVAGWLMIHADFGLGLGV